MTKRYPKRFETREMRRQRETALADAARDDEVAEACRRAVRRGMAVHARAERHCPMRVCRRARACVSGSFACLAQLRRPVLPPLAEDLAVDALHQHLCEEAEVRR
jgi:hypothetical protein